jgi:hypothetical protein
MKYFHRIASTFKAEPVLEDLRSQPLLWSKSPRVTFPGSPHVDTEDIVLRGPIGFEYKTLPELHAELQCEDYPASGMMTKTLVRARNLAWLLSPKETWPHGGLRLGRVILTKIRPNLTIHPHRDEGPVPAFYRRIHLCVQGGDGNIFMIQGEVQVMQTGEIWECDVRKMHTVINLMDHDRIHLIVDIER